MAYDLNPYKISKMNTSDIHKEYTRLRAIANKRIARLEKAGLRAWGRESGIPFATIRQIRESSKWDVASQLAEVSRFLRKRSTVTTERRYLESFSEIMKEKGYGSLVATPSDAYQLMDFMEEMREQYSDKVFDSGDALDVLKEAQRLKIPLDKVKKNFETFLENLDELEKVKPSKNGREFSQRRINTLIKKWSD